MNGRLPEAVKQQKRSPAKSAVLVSEVSLAESHAQVQAWHAGAAGRRAGARRRRCAMERRCAAGSWAALPRFTLGAQQARQRRTATAQRTAGDAGWIAGWHDARAGLASGDGGGADGDGKILTWTYQ